MKKSEAFPVAGDYWRPKYRAEHQAWMDERDKHPSANPLVIERRALMREWDSIEGWPKFYPYRGPDGKWVSDGRSERSYAIAVRIDELSRLIPMAELLAELPPVPEGSGRMRFRTGRANPNADCGWDYSSDEFYILSGQPRRDEIVKTETTGGDSR